MVNGSARFAPTRDDLVNAVASFALTAIALLGFQATYGGSSFLVLGMGAAVVGILIGYAGERLGFALPATIAIVALIYLLVGGVVALPHRAAGGFIPTGGSISAALSTAITGWKEIITISPPIGRTGDLMVLPVFAGVTSGFASFITSKRLKFLPPAILAPAIVLGLSIATGTNEPVSVTVQGAFFGAAAIAWLAWREDQRRPLLTEGVGRSWHQVAPAAVVLAVAAVVGFAVSDHLPMAGTDSRDIWRQTVTPPFDPREHPSPLSTYRDYVKKVGQPGSDATADPVMFTVEGLPADVPVRLATMDAYDGLVWQVSSGDPAAPSLNDSGSFERVGASLKPEFDGSKATVTITIGDYSDVWVPDVGEVESLRFTGSAGGEGRDRELADGFRYNRATDTAASRIRLESGDRYVMTVRLPTGLETLAGEEIVPTVPQLGQASSVGAVTQALAGPELLAVNDTGERLDRTRDLMHEVGTYSDGDVTAGQVRAQAGHSDFRLTSFVKDFPSAPLIGNAEQYASTYALLFRDLGHIPTRVLMGFMPPEASTDAPVDVLASNVEAWVEVPVDELGWVAVFPTPPRDQTAINASTAVTPPPDYRTQNPPPPPLIDPEFDQPAKSSGKAVDPDEKAEDASEDEATAAPGSSWYEGRAVKLAAVGVSPFLVLAAAVGAIVMLKARRRKHRKERGQAHERIAAGWREITDFAIDAGKPVPPSTTRREAAAFIGQDTLRLAEKADEAVWSADHPADRAAEHYWSELTEALDAMRRSLPRTERAKALVSVQSLREERRRRKLVKT